MSGFSRLERLRQGLKKKPTFTPEEEELFDLGLSVEDIAAQTEKPLATVANHYSAIERHRQAAGVYVNGRRTSRPHRYFQES